MKFDLHPHQTRALDTLRTSLLAGYRRPMVQAPTGAGKTVIAAAIVDGALAKGKRVLFVVPFLSLVDQTVAAFVGQGITERRRHPGLSPDDRCAAAGPGGVNPDTAAACAAAGRYRHCR